MGRRKRLVFLVVEHEVGSFSGEWIRMNNGQIILACLLPLLLGLYGCGGISHGGEGVLVEAESFATRGGWKVDQQFDQIMGSSYLLAHGMGQPVANAKTTVAFPQKGSYHLWVRTKDWVPGDWDAPGRFQVVVNGQTLKTVFGTIAGWTWHYGGTVEIAAAAVSIELKDLTGFEGRCDALYFSTSPKDVPPSTLKAMGPWRTKHLRRPAVPPLAGTFDVVIVGGGIAGCGAALAADKQGLKVALIHDRPLLGGNASSEVRVHTLGIYGQGGAILKGLDTEHWPNGSDQAISDTTKRHKTMAAAKNVQMFLSCRAYAANTKGSTITSVDARHIATGETKRFTAPVFIDCTGDGWIGFWAGAKYRYGRESVTEFSEAWPKHGERWSPKTPDKLTMGTSLLWNSEADNKPSPFPAVPWAMGVAKKNQATHGKWSWEYATNDKHQIHDAEEIRDHMLRAIYGSFANAKKQAENANQRLAWVGYIAGKRESRRLMGDYIYTMSDAATKRTFPDTVAEERREIDVHYQTPPGGFLSRALFYKTHGLYSIPFRTLYSKNIDNLMMAGRCFSCSHIGLGGPRVMKTTGQMGIATGYAASLCKKYKTTPRGVYKNHIAELRHLIGYRKSKGKK